MACGKLHKRPLPAAGRGAPSEEEAEMLSWLIMDCLHFWPLRRLVCTLVCTHDFRVVYA